MRATSGTTCSATDTSWFRNLLIWMSMNCIFGHLNLAWFRFIYIQQKVTSRCHEFLWWHWFCSFLFTCLMQKIGYLHLNLNELTDMIDSFIKKTQGQMVSGTRYGRWPWRSDRVQARKLQRFCSLRCPTPDPIKFFFPSYISTLLPVCIVPCRVWGVRSVVPRTFFVFVFVFFFVFFFFFFTKKKNFYKSPEFFFFFFLF